MRKTHSVKMINGYYRVISGSDYTYAGARAEAQRLNSHNAQQQPITFDDITSGLGVGGTGSDDFNISTERDPMLPEYNRNAYSPGQHVCPTGTTMGVRGDDDDRCVYCGNPGDWNSGAGRVLCSRHWDEY